MTLIVVNLQYQVMRCEVCKEVVEIPRALLRDQHALLELQQATAHDHRECKANPHDLAKAIRDRMFRKRVERELRKSEKPEKNALPRCRNRRLGRLPG